MKKFIYANLKYPEEARKNKIEGTVVLRIGIDYKGNVIDSKVKSSLGYGCDEEAQRVVGLLKYEVNNKVRRGKVLFHKILNIHFKVAKKATSTTEISYQITKKKEEKSPSNSGSIDYTITI